MGCFRLDFYSSLVYLVDFLGAQRSPLFFYASPLRSKPKPLLSTIRKKR